MNIAIAAIEEDFKPRPPARHGLSGAERRGVSHEEFRSSGDVVTVTALASGLTSGEATGTLAAMVRVRLGGVAVEAVDA
jgi:hypothetical protein